MDERLAAAPEADAPDVSAIVVAGSRIDDVRKLFLDYWDALNALERTFELIYVIDGEKPDVAQELRRLQNEGHGFRIIQLSRKFGDATALMCGFDHAAGSHVLLLPAYYQTEPGDLGKLFAAIDTADMVIARRWPRRGSRFEQLRRDIFHDLLKWVTGSQFNDLGCMVQLFDRRVLQEIRVYGDQHRFLPILARNNGFRIIEIDLRQSDRDEFRGQYRWREYLHRFLDIFTIFFLVRFTKKPLRFFGMIGSALFTIGGLVLLVVVFERIFFHTPLADRPALLLSSLMVVLGLQIFGLGLLGELIIFTHARALKEYKVAAIVENGVSREVGPVGEPTSRTA